MPVAWGWATSWGAVRSESGAKGQGPRAALASMSIGGGRELKGEG